MPQRSRGSIINFDVVDPDIVDNITVKDVLGNKDDSPEGSSLYARARTVEDHIHTEQKLYPELANSIQVVGGSGVWELGTLTTLMPANTANIRFDIHWIVICAISVNDEYELILYADTTQIGRIAFTRTDKKDVDDGVPFQCPILEPEVRIRARLASAGGGDTANFKLLYHEY